MIEIKKNIDLTPYTTIKIGARAAFFAVVANDDDLLAAISWARSKKLPIFVLGGGSNILFARRFPGLVLKSEMKGWKKIKETAANVWIEAAAGESWIKLVSWTTVNGWYGLENLAAIYGTVGAAPIQNIGAYGVELESVFEHLEAIDLKNGRVRIFSKEDCRFGYRDSIFKGRYRQRFFITKVVLKLSKKARLNLEYAGIKEELARQGALKPDAAAVARAVAAVRDAKLPRPGLQPNAGSFFKNPEISAAAFRRLAAKYPDLPHFAGSQGKIKIPAAWLIERSGFKGKRFGKVGMSERQALILVNYGGASARSALALAARIKAAVKKRFGLDLQEEVNIV